MKTGELIASGRTAEIYSLNEKEVVKLFREWVPDSDVEYESNLTKEISLAGIESPRVGEIVEMKGRKGFVMEYLNGVPLGEFILHKPWYVKKMAGEMARLHFSLHEKKAASGMVTTHERLAKKIQHAEGLSDNARDLVLKRLEQSRQERQICHNDFHPWNILVNDNKGMVIDWIDASAGSPAADFTRTMVILEGIIHNNISTPLQGIFLRVFIMYYRKYYCRLNPSAEKEYFFWKPIIAAGRLSENADGQNAWLLGQIEKYSTGKYAKKNLHSNSEYTG